MAGSELLHSGTKVAASEGRLFLQELHSLQDCAFECYGKINCQIFSYTRVTSHHGMCAGGPLDAPREDDGQSVLYKVVPRLWSPQAGPTVVPMTGPTVTPMTHTHGARSKVYSDSMPGWCRGPVSVNQYVRDKMRNGVADYLECMDYCDDDTGCAGFSFQEDGGWCYVYGDIDVRSPPPWTVRNEIPNTQVGTAASGWSHGQVNCWRVLRTQPEPRDGLRPPLPPDPRPYPPTPLPHPPLPIPSPPPDPPPPPPPSPPPPSPPPPSPPPSSPACSSASVASGYVPLSEEPQYLDTTMSSFLFSSVVFCQQGCNHTCNNIHEHEHTYNKRRKIERPGAGGIGGQAGWPKSDLFVSSL